jgi:hypothetical protein
VVLAGVTSVAIPLVTGMLPGMTSPVPLANTPVRLIEVPAVIMLGLPAKLLMAGAGGALEPPPPQAARASRQRPAMLERRATARRAIPRMATG